MGRGIQGAALKALGAQDHVMTVVSRERRAEHFIRIHFRSETLLQDIIDTPGSFIRGWFPDPDGGNKQFQRGYTIINADPTAGTFDIDFVIHQPLGPASAWALNCETGDELVVTVMAPMPLAYWTRRPRDISFLETWRRTRPYAKLWPAFPKTRK